MSEVNISGNKPELTKGELEKANDQRFAKAKKEEFYSRPHTSEKTKHFRRREFDGVVKNEIIGLEKNGKMIFGKKK